MLPIPAARAPNRRELRVIFDLAAGHTTDRVVTAGTAMRIMTGAPMPAGADAIVPFEETDEGGEPTGRSRSTVRVYKEARPGANIRRAGEDIRQGEIILTKGAILRPAEIGVLASVGLATVKVVRRPRVGHPGHRRRADRAGRCPGSRRDLTTRTTTVLLPLCSAPAVCLSSSALPGTGWRTSHPGFMGPSQPGPISCSPARRFGRRVRPGEARPGQ